MESQTDEGEAKRDDTQRGRIPLRIYTDEGDANMITLCRRQGPENVNQIRQSGWTDVRTMSEPKREEHDFSFPLAEPCPYSLLIGQMKIIGDFCWTNWAAEKNRRSPSFVMPKDGNRNCRDQGQQRQDNVPAIRLRIR